jgi:hypothetical protein
MKAQPTIPPSLVRLKAGFLAFLFAMPLWLSASTLWTGPNTNFINTGGQADVLVPGALSIARTPGSFLYNTNVDLFGSGEGTPSDTEWAFGTIDQFNSLTYEPFSQIRDDGRALGLHVFQYLLTGGPTNGPKPMVVHIINEDIYLSLTFSQWGSGGNATFAYTRSTPGAVVPPTPTVTITNPIAGAVFAAPANVKISANASVSGGGTVTNVSFFFQGSAIPIGSSAAAPFSVTASNLAASAYSLKAVATAAGVSGTSSVVNISVVTPVITALSAPGDVNNQFSFSYNVNPGLRYVIESSSNLFVWSPVVTNLAGSSPLFFTNGIAPANRFYRVGRLPNP